MTKEPSRAAINELLALFDHAMDERAAELAGITGIHWRAISPRSRPMNGTSGRPGEGARSASSPPISAEPTSTQAMRSGTAPADGAIARSMASDRVDTGGDARLAAVDARHAPQQHVRIDRRPTRRAAKGALGEKYEARRLIEIQIQHSLYHVGEINHIRALLQGNDDWDHEDMGRDEGG